MVRGYFRAFHSVLNPRLIKRSQWPFSGAGLAPDNPLNTGLKVARAPQGTFYKFVLLGLASTHNLPIIL